MSLTRDIVAIIDAPEITLTEDDIAPDALTKFYQAIGWNNDDYLDPRKVRTTPEVYLNLYNIMCEKCSDHTAVGMFMLNKAPGVDDDIPQNKVYLLKGWITPSN